MFSHQELGTVLFAECFLTQQRGTAWGNVWEWPICRHIDSTTVQYWRDSLMKLVAPKARTRSISLHSPYIDIPSWLQKDLFSNHWRLFIHFLPKKFLADSAKINKQPQELWRSGLPHSFLSEREFLLLRSWFHCITILSLLFCGHISFLNCSTKIRLQYIKPSLLSGY